MCSSSLERAVGRHRLPQPADLEVPAVGEASDRKARVDPAVDLAHVGKRRPPGRRRCGDRLDDRRREAAPRREVARPPAPELRGARRPSPASGGAASAPGSARTRGSRSRARTSAHTVRTRSPCALRLRLERLEQGGVGVDSPDLVVRDRRGGGRPGPSRSPAPGRAPAAASASRSQTGRSAA